ncbi:hypothetical protein KSP39_PZI022914 [Platanthera zijinensis]|uniref:Uncharacterized protein n=1 Tax=Platanthera zijinensis TaxID=2320716 RepID=A0AAP0AUP2_9ASPA
MADRAIGHVSSWGGGSVNEGWQVKGAAVWRPGGQPWRFTIPARLHDRRTPRWLRPAWRPIAGVCCRALGGEWLHGRRAVRWGRRLARRQAVGVCGHALGARGLADACLGRAVSQLRGGRAARRRRLAMRSTGRAVLGSRSGGPVAACIHSEGSAFAQFLSLLLLGCFHGRNTPPNLATFPSDSLSPLHHPPSPNLLHLLFIFLLISVSYRSAYFFSSPLLGFHGRNTPTEPRERLRSWWEGVHSSPPLHFFPPSSSRVPMIPGYPFCGFRSRLKKISRKMNWASRKIHLYNVTMGLYMLDWWERYLIMLFPNSRRYFVSGVALVHFLQWISIRDRVLQQICEKEEKFANRGNEDGKVTISERFYFAEEFPEGQKLFVEVTEARRCLYHGESGDVEGEKEGQPRSQGEWSWRLDHEEAWSEMAVRLLLTTRLPGSCFYGVSLLSVYLLPPVDPLPRPPSSPAFIVILLWTMGLAVFFFFSSADYLRHGRHVFQFATVCPPRSGGGLLCSLLFTHRIPVHVFQFAAVCCLLYSARCCLLATTYFPLGSRGLLRAYVAVCLRIALRCLFADCSPPSACGFACDLLVAVCLQPWLLSAGSFPCSACYFLANCSWPCLLRRGCSTVIARSWPCFLSDALLAATCPLCSLAASSSSCHKLISSSRKVCCRLYLPGRFPYPLKTAAPCIAAYLIRAVRGLLA